MENRELEFDYTDLKLRIKKYFGGQEAFAAAMGWNNYIPLNQRLNNSVDWKMPEVVKACDLLEIELINAHLYFCVQKV